MRVETRNDGGILWSAAGGLRGWLPGQGRGGTAVGSRPGEGRDGPGGGRGLMGASAHTPARRQAAVREEWL